MLDGRVAWAAFNWAALNCAPDRGWRGISREQSRCGRAEGCVDFVRFRMHIPGWLGSADATQEAQPGGGHHCPYRSSLLLQEHAGGSG